MLKFDELEIKTINPPDELLNYKAKLKLLRIELSKEKQAREKAQSTYSPPKSFSLNQRTRIYLCANKNESPYFQSLKSKGKKALCIHQNRDEREANYS